MLLGTWSPQRLRCSNILHANHFFQWWTQQNDPKWQFPWGNYDDQKRNLFHRVHYVQRRCRILKSLSDLRVHGPQGNTRYGMNQVLFDAWSFAFPTNMSVSISDMAGWDGQTGHGATSLHQHPLPVAFKAKSRVTLESCGRSAFGELDG